MAETQLIISPSILYFDYTEFSTTDEVLDRELGWLPGVEAKVSSNITSDCFISIHSSYYQGTVDYTGRTQSGAPHTTDTDTKLLRFGGRIEKSIYKKHIYLSVHNYINGTEASGTTIISAALMKPINGLNILSV